MYLLVRIIAVKPKISKLQFHRTAVVNYRVRDWEEGREIPLEKKIE